MKNTLHLCATGMLLAITALLPMAAHAERPGLHPAYLDSLTDLRDAH